LDIRKAVAEESATLSEIAQETKRYWGYPEHWLEHWREQLTISPQFVDQHEVFVAETDGAIVGFYALIAEGNNAELEHLWVAPSHIGQGVGKELFLHAMQVAAERKFLSVDILADPNAEGFYKRMGASRTGESISELDGKPRVLPRLKIDPRS
jgi:GNAT superfamily N-acetyltransferase